MMEKTPKAPPAPPRARAAIANAGRVGMTMAIAAATMAIAPLTRGAPDASQPQERGTPPPARGTRAASFTPSTYNAAARTVEAVFSAGTAVNRWYGTEALTISEEAIDLTRVAAGLCPLLNSHNQRDLDAVLGRVLDARIEDGQLVGTFLFADTDAGRAAEGRVARGEVLGISVGYIVRTWTLTILSLGLVQSVGPLLIDKTPVAFDAGGQAIGTYRGNMWLDTQRGACPEARALAGPFGAFPGWDPSSKLSGLAADIWTLDFDTKNEKFPNGVPDRGRVLEGILVYDPRLDSTYPGGNGACRLGQPSTYVYSENPGPHAITWAYGHYQNGVLMAGGGLRASGIDLAPFVEWANVCDANKWKVGGLVYSTTDNAWDVLKMICQAGAAEPLPVSAQLSVTFAAPRVSIGTITSADIIGDIDAPATVGSRRRRNTIIPSVRLETHGWEMTPIDPVVVPAYVAIDGGSRPKEVSYPLVQDATQGAQLALYEMLNDRELDGIVVPAKIYALGYRPGDCITLQVPEANLIGREVIVRQREIDGGTLGVALTCRTEDSSKHAFALGKTGTPPRTPDLSNPGIDRSAPAAGDWSVAGTTLSADGVATPALIIIGTAARITADEVIFDYRPYVAGAAPDLSWTGASLEPATVTRKEITSVTATTSYEVGIRYRMRGALSDRLILGPVATGAYEGVGGGAAAYTMLLTNDLHQLPADAAGNVTSYAGATTTIQVFRGASDVTSEFDLGYDDLPVRNPQGLEVVGTYPDFAVVAGLDPSEPTAAFTFLVVGKANTASAGVTLRKTFSLSKSMPGADGSPPALLSLSASATVARYDANGALVTGQSVSFRAMRRNSAVATVWYLIKSDGAEVFSGTAQDFVTAGPAYWTTTDNDNLTLTEIGLGANMAAHGGALGRISLRASLGAYGAVSDTISVQKVQDGASGLDAETYTLSSMGLIASNAPPAGYRHGLWRGDGTVFTDPDNGNSSSGFARSYTVCWRRSRNDWKVRHFDVFGNGEVVYPSDDYAGGDRQGIQGLINLLAAIPAGTPVAIYTSDEPVRILTTPTPIRPTAPSISRPVRRVGAPMSASPPAPRQRSRQSPGSTPGRNTRGHPSALPPAAPSSRPGARSSKAAVSMPGTATPIRRSAFAAARSPRGRQGRPIARSWPA